MTTKVLESEIDSVEIKIGNVIQLWRESDKSVHNMIVFPMNEDGQLGAIEELWSEDKITVDPMRCGNYCIIDRDEFPRTLGINPVFGDHIVMVYPHLGYNLDESKVKEIMYYDENGAYCSYNNKIKY